ncbi:MAG: DUF2155 domain-containing protein [Pararhodobacter sp.]
MTRAAIVAGAVLVLWPVLATAQINLAPLVPNPPAREAGPEMASGQVAVMRALDKVSGAREDLEIPVGGTAHYGRLSVHLVACRFPAENPSSDAFAFVEIRDARRDEQLFRGWMIASSPALNALDHPRYDIWALRCR